MVHVTKESLAARIAELESSPRSLKEDYTLAAYKMLLATMDSDPVVDMFVAEVVKNLVDALSGPVILGPIHVSSGTDHAKIGAKVAEVLALRYPMFIFHDVSAKGFVEIRINQK